MTPIVISVVAFVLLFAASLFGMTLIAGCLNITVPKKPRTRFESEWDQLLFEDTETSISMPLIGIMVFWLALTFVSIGLFAPSNRIVILAQLLASFSIAGAIFLLLELDQPFAGIVKISSKPMVSALDHLMK